MRTDAYCHKNWLIFVTRGTGTWPSWQLVGAILGIDILASIFALFGWLSGPAPNNGSVYIPNFPQLLRANDNTDTPTLLLSSKCGRTRSASLSLLHLSTFYSARSRCVPFSLLDVNANCQMIYSSWIISVRRWYVCADIYVAESTDKVSCTARNEEREARGLLDQLETSHASTRDERQ